jgi:arylformamidase
MKIYDVTVVVSPTMPVWPNNPGVELERMNKIEAGANSNVSRLAMGVHSGTTRRRSGAFHSGCRRGGHA